MVVAGCAGGGPGTVPDDDPGLPGDTGGKGVPGPMTDAEKTAAVEGIEALVEAADLSEVETGAPILAAKMRARDDVVQADVDEESGVVWAVLRDGTTYNLLLNFSPEIQSAGDAQHSEALAALEQASVRTNAGVPHGKKAYVRDSLGTCFDLSVTPQLRGYLDKAGYDVDVVPGDEDVEDYRNITGASMVYIHTHGGFIRPAVGIKQTESGHWVLDYASGENEPPKMFGLWTETPFTVTNLQKYKAEIASGDLVLAGATTDRKDDGTCTKPSMFMVSSSFIKKHWSLEPDSVVFLNTCFSGNPEVTEALFSKGAGLVLGWTWMSSSTVTPKFVMDRLLGANTYNPQSPEQRAFHWPEVQREGRELGVLTTQFTENMNRFIDTFRPIKVDSELLFMANPVHDAGALAPSIKQLKVDEDRERLVVEGWFGSNEGRVTINGAAVAVQQWTAQVIEVTLPRNGPGSYGEVVVEVDGRESNPVPLTEWRGKLTYTFNQAEGLEYQFEWDLHFRGDFHSYRTELDGTPEGGGRDFILSRDTKAKLRASGSVTDVESDGDTSTVEWTGTQQIPWDEGDTGSSQTHFGEIKVVVKPDGTVDPSASSIILAMTAQGEYTQNAYKNGALIGSNQIPAVMLWLLGLSDLTVFGGLGAVSLELDANYNVLPGKRQDSLGTAGEGFVLEWTKLTARGAPKPSQAR